MARIQVAYYMDQPEGLKLLEKSIQSVRQHMNCRIIHITSVGGPKSPLADEWIEAEGKTFTDKRASGCAKVQGPCLFLGSDVICHEPVPEIFDLDCDLAIATDVKPGAPGIEYNADVIFTRSPDFWHEIKRRAKGMKWPNGDWFELEMVYNRLAKERRATILDGNLYNYVPEGPEDKKGKLIHYRGKRKSWLFPITGFQSGLNTSMDVMIRQSQENMGRGLPMFEEIPPHDIEALIVGGGPSLKDTLTNLRFRKARGGVIYALNGTHDWLIERGIIPDFHVLLDARPDNVCFVQKPHKKVVYLVAAQCHSSIYEALRGFEVVQWVACTDTPENDAKMVGNRPVMIVGGGATVALKTMNLAFLAGHRKMSIFGMDSSYRDEANHAYPQPLNDAESRMTIHAAGKDFICAPWMAKQAIEFQAQARQLMGEGVRLTVHGDGLIPHIANQWR